MPKFGQREKEWIQQDLLTKGRDLFVKQGLKKTSISDITKSVGIAQGSFYNFYESKEVLYLEILEQEEEKIREQLVLPFFQSGNVTRESFKSFLMEAFSVMETNAFIRQLFDEGIMESLLRKLPEEKVAHLVNSDVDFFTPLVEKLQRENVIVEEQSEVVIQLLRMVFLLFLQKQQIGEEHFAESMDLLLTFISNGLIKKVD
ncbi:TetR/AcrR family transcriptional regulator [Oceanobacillus jordanicus]|uniref:TetR/AcrR family transcriptional regulator n=1 Tax=Oceanobacillus jordanicus TaxID=2867266 RepID=A0AAW5B8G5_9BACI|nr:TetR/AcrR family transcriptional regulator [Oceanobacillus jordanicus]MCG3420661.1 TetR/AcrR family transcriptional regulator [Oceanobacillus jordanicus]